MNIVDDEAANNSSSCLFCPYDGNVGTVQDMYMNVSSLLIICLRSFGHMCRYTGSELAKKHLNKFGIEPIFQYDLKIV